MDNSKKITELPEASSISNNDWLVMVDVANDETKKIHAGEVGGNVPIQDTAPQDPEENDLWIDTSEPEEMQEAIKNEYSESTSDTYSCDYVNTALSNIIETGSNENGNYIKYDNGIMICYNAESFTNVQCTYLWGNIYGNSNDRRNLKNFPQTFISKPICMLRIDDTSGDCWLITNNNIGGASATNPGGWQIGRGSSSTLDVSISYLAIGRWK